MRYLQNMQYLGNKLRSDYDTCSSNKCSKLRYRGINTMHIRVKLMYDHDRTTHGHLTERFPSSIVNDIGQSSIGKVRQNHVALRMNTTFKEVLRKFLMGPSHHGTEREEEQQKKMSQNEEGSETEWIYTWVPCTIYPRETGRETEKHNHNRVPTKEKRGYICMKNA